MKLYAKIERVEESERECACCKRNHRKLYLIDGYWLGVNCAQSYDIYANYDKAGRDITSLYWRGSEKKFEQVKAMAG